MAGSRSSPGNLQASKWYSHSFYNEAAAHLSKHTSDFQFCNKNVTSDVTGDRQHDQESGTGRSRNISEIPIHIFPDTQTGRNCTTNIQSETFEQLCKGQEFSIVQPFSSTIISARQGLDGQTGPEPGLLSPAHSPTAPQVPQGELQRHTLPNDLSPLWTFVSPRTFRCSYQLDGRLPAGTQYSLCGLSGRFLVGQPVLRAASRTGDIYCSSNATTGLVNQLQQICVGSDSAPRVLRCHVGYTNQYQIPVGTKMPNATQGTTDTDFARQLVPQTGPVPNGETQFCLVCRSQGKATLSNNAILQSTTAEIPAPPTISHSGTSSCRDALVGDSGIQHITVARGARLTPAHHRCLGDRLGSTTRTDETIRSVDGSPTILARQLQGAVRGPCCDRSPAAAAGELAHSITDGQSHSSGLHQQRRRHKIKEATKPNPTAVGSAGSAQYRFNGEILSRPIQHRGGRTLTEQGKSRVAPPSSSDETDISDVGDTGGGSLRIEDRPCSTGLCFHRPTRRECSISQRVSPSLGLQAGLGISTTQSHTAGVVSPELCSRSVHTSNSTLGETILESRSPTEGHSDTVSDSGPSTSFDRHEDRPSSSRGATHMLGGMADSRWADLITDWTPEEKSLLLASWRKSTLNTYATAWNKWKRWCISNSVDFKHPDPSIVAKYLAYLHNKEGLAYRTILVHKSAISTFTKTSEQDISSNFLVRQILRAISLTKVKKPKPPIWNPRDVLEYLCANSPDENNLYQVSRRSAILLLLASGRRVHDLTLLKIGPEHLIDEGESIILWPTFGSKTDSATSRQSGWKIKQHPERNLDAVYWIRLLIKVSQNRRNEGNWSELFITPRGPCKPATRTIIGGWIKSTLREAGIEASPGSVRSAVSSLNWLENYTIDQILSTGNWKREHTFRTYYHKEININRMQDNNVSLSQYFEAV